MENTNTNDRKATESIGVTEMQNKTGELKRYGNIVMTRKTSHSTVWVKRLPYCEDLKGFKTVEEATKYFNSLLG